MDRGKGLCGGPSFRRLEHDTQLSASTLADIFSGRSLARWDVIERRYALRTSFPQAEQARAREHLPALPGSIAKVAGDQARMLTVVPRIAAQQSALAPGARARAVVAAGS